MPSAESTRSCQTTGLPQSREKRFRVHRLARRRLRPASELRLGPAALPLAIGAKVGPDPNALLRAHAPTSCVGAHNRTAVDTAKRSLCPPLPLRTISDSAAFARVSTTALAGEGRAAGIACASAVGVELHMHRDVDVCSIGHDELTAVLLLRQQRGHAAHPAPRLWNGRCDAGRTKRVNYRIGGSV